jgi:hypothetical protein
METYMALRLPQPRITDFWQPSKLGKRHESDFPSELSEEPTY